MPPNPTTWTHLPHDLRVYILSLLPLWDALSLHTASPTNPQRTHLRNRITNLHPLYNAWVNATQPTLRSYSNPPYLSHRTARLNLTPSQFAQLPTLPLGGTALTSLSSISELLHLRVLDASRNALTQIPDELSRCKNLRVLNLGRNNLSQFPHVVLQLPQLRTLLLHHNRILQLPKHWSGMHQLYRLGLFDCAISADLPEELCRMLGTQTDTHRRRSANLQHNPLNPSNLASLFRRFPLMATAVVL